MNVLQDASSDLSSIYPKSLVTIHFLPSICWWLHISTSNLDLDLELSSTAFFPDPLRCVNPTYSKPSSYSSPALLLLRQLKQKTIESFLIHLFFSLPTFNSLVKAVDSTFKICSKSDQFSSPQLLPRWSKTPSSTAWVIVIVSYLVFWIPSLLCSSLFSTQQLKQSI